MKTEKKPKKAAKTLATLNNEKVDATKIKGGIGITLNPSFGGGGSGGNGGG